jgi:hypothetical protein
MEGSGSGSWSPTNLRIRIHKRRTLERVKLFLCVCGQVKNAVGGKHNKRQQHSARQDLIEFTIKTETEEFEGDNDLRLKGSVAGVEGANSMRIRI